MSQSWTCTRPQGKTILLATLGFLVILIIVVTSHPATSASLATSWQQLQDKHPSLTGVFGTASNQPVDTFVEFRKAPECSFTTQDLHWEFEPKCSDREQLLNAMNGGGRHGFNQPYASLGCDFKWFSTDEICDIMSRFDRVYIAGDSMTRQIAIALHILLRADLIGGGRQTWKHDGSENDKGCYCRRLFSKQSDCFWWEAIDTDGVKNYAPESIPCKQKIGSFSLQFLAAYPLKAETWEGSLKSLTEKHTEGDRSAFVLQHGAWNDYKVNATIGWINQLEAHWGQGAPYFLTSPRLYISPPANGENKHPWLIDKGNNIVVQQFVHGIDKFVKDKGYDHLAFYNLTVQSTSFDGTHTSLEATLTEAMMILNWLDSLSWG